MLYSDDGSQSRATFAITQKNLLRSYLIFLLFISRYYIVIKIESQRYMKQRNTCLVHLNQNSFSKQKSFSQDANTSNRHLRNDVFLSVI